MSNVLPSQEDRVTIPRMTTMGFIVRSEGGYYFVRLEDGIVVRSTIRGRLRQQRSEDTAFLTLGDRVILTWSTLEDGLIEERLPRSSELARKSPLPGRRRPHRQVLLAPPSILTSRWWLSWHLWQSHDVHRFLPIASWSSQRMREFVPS
ncbi:MAG: hypothetical protein M1298_05375 [Chloroflexi bacterium]|nr:hypothetical protein [Chloroflexota bacterium]